MPKQRMDLRAIAEAGEVRAAALRLASAQVDLIADQVLQADDPNFKLAEQTSGINRATIKTRALERAAADERGEMPEVLKKIGRQLARAERRLIEAGQ